MMFKIEKAKQQSNSYQSYKLYKLDEIERKIDSAIFEYSKRGYYNIYFNPDIEDITSAEISENDIMKILKKYVDNGYKIERFFPFSYSISWAE